MKIRMQSGIKSDELNARGWDFAVIGDAVDDRGRASTAFCKENCRSTIATRYDPHEMMIDVDNNRHYADDLGKFVDRMKASSILLEATTLGFVEIFLFCKAAKDLGISTISFLYTEPIHYKVDDLSKIHNRTKVLHRRDFELSDEVEDFAAVPGAALMLGGKRTRLVFLVGYEGQRLAQALEQTDFRPSDCSVVFGVPAYQPGWEMDSFANNIRVIREKSIREFSYTGAQNPAGVYNRLERLYASCDSGQRMLVSPIGTKPHGIGAALFACDHGDVGLLYDNPVRKQGRSLAVASWHLFDVTLIDR